MGSKLDAMKAAAKGGARTDRDGGSQVPPKAGAADVRLATSPPPSPPGEVVVSFHCGHTRTVKQVHGGNCPACGEKVRQEAAARRKAKREAKQAERAAAKKPIDEGRLPDGAKFVVVYHADVKEWAGILRMPGSGDEDLVFEDSASGVFRLLKQLDAQYRASLAPPADLVRGSGS